MAAFQLVLPVQLDLHITISLNAQGSLSCFRVNIVLCSGVAHIDLHVFQGEVQHRIGKVVDHRNGVAPKAIFLFVHRGRGCRSSSRGCLLGLGPGTFLLLSALLPVGAFRFLGALRLVGVLRLLSILRPVGILRLLSILRLGRLVVVLYHRAKAGILCCGAFQVTLLRGGGRSSGGDDDLIIVPNLLCLTVALFDGLALLIFGDGNIAFVDIVGP